MSRFLWFSVYNEHSITADDIGRRYAIGVM